MSFIKYLRYVCNIAGTNTEEVYMYTFDTDILSIQEKSAKVQPVLLDCYKSVPCSVMMMKGKRLGRLLCLPVCPPSMNGSGNEPAAE